MTPIKKELITFLKSLKGGNPQTTQAIADAIAFAEQQEDSTMPKKSLNSNELTEEQKEMQKRFFHDLIHGLITNHPELFTPPHGEINSEKTIAFLRNIGVFSAEDISPKKGIR